MFLDRDIIRMSLSPNYLLNITEIQSNYLLNIMEIQSKIVVGFFFEERKCKSEKTLFLITEMGASLSF